MDWNRYILVIVLVLLIIITSVILVNKYCYPEEVKGGLYFNLDVNSNDTNNMTLENIYKNLSKDNNLKLMNTTEDIYVRGHDNFSYNETSELNVLVIKSDEWKYVDHMSVYLYPDKNLHIYGESSVYSKNAFDRGAFSESSEESKNTVRSMMKSINIDIKNKDISIGDNDFAMLDSQMNFCFVWFMIIFAIMFVVNNIYKFRVEKLKHENTPMDKIIYKINFIDVLFIFATILITTIGISELFIYLKFPFDFSFLLAGVIVFAFGCILYLFKDKFKDYIAYY